MTEMLATIDCSASPYDVRPILDAIMMRVRKLRTEAPDKPVVILMGEYHSISTHRMLQTLLLERLNDELPDVPCAVALELEVNMAESIGQTVYNTESKAMRTALAKHDDNGHMMTKLVLANIVTGHAPFAFWVLLAAALITPGLSIHCTDAPDDEDLVVGEGCTTAGDISMRNAHMADALDELARGGKQIIMQHCGMAHVVGHHSLTEPASFEDSLVVHLARKDTVSVLPVLIDVNLMDGLHPEGQAYMAASGLTVTGLESKQFTEQHLALMNVQPHLLRVRSIELESDLILKTWNASSAHQFSTSADLFYWIKTEQKAAEIACKAFCDAARWEQFKDDIKVGVKRLLPIPL